MTRIQLFAAALPSLCALAACSPLSHATRADAASTPPMARATDAPTQVDAATEKDDTDDAPTMLGRKPGDFVVYRFSGTFRRQPIVLTERVLAREGTFLVVDVVFEEGKTKQQFHVRMNDAKTARGEVSSVARVESGVEKPASIGLFEALMARTALVADQNEAVLGTEPASVDVGNASIPVTRTTYRVRVGKREAIMRTFASSTFAWGDVASEIRAADGTLLYRAEVVDAGAIAPKSAAPVASSDDE